MRQAHPTTKGAQSLLTFSLEEPITQVASFQAPKALLSDHPYDWHDLALLGMLDEVRFLAVEDYPLHIVQVHKVKHIERPIAPTFSARVFLAWTGALINDLWWYQDQTEFIEFRNDVSWPQWRSLRNQGRIIQQTLAYVQENGHSICLLNHEPSVSTFIRRDFESIGRHFD